MLNLKIMTMKNAIAIISIGLMIIGCSKPQQCELNSTGSLKVVSTEIEPYYTYVNDVYYGITEPATFTTFSGLPTGLNTLDFINVNDNNEAYIGTVSIATCTESSIQL